MCLIIINVCIYCFLFYTKCPKASPKNSKIWYLESRRTQNVTRVGKAFPLPVFTRRKNFKYLNTEVKYYLDQIQHTCVPTIKVIS